MLKKMMFALAVTGLSLSAAHAQAELAQGEVHGPIPGLDVNESITMVFRPCSRWSGPATDEFDVERLNGALTITVLEKRN